MLNMLTIARSKGEKMKQENEAGTPCVEASNPSYEPALGKEQIKIPERSF
jgi:hypothetical protein